MVFGRERCFDEASFVRSFGSASCLRPRHHKGIVNRLLVKRTGGSLVTDYRRTFPWHRFGGSRTGLGLPTEREPATGDVSLTAAAEYGNRRNDRRR